MSPTVPVQHLSESAQNAGPYTLAGCPGIGDPWQLA
jgi:hypothetical protein